MTIHKVTPDDEGVYSVIAQLEPRGEARSTAELHLTTKEIKFEMKPPDIPDSRVPTPTMPIRAVPPEEIKTISSCPIRNSAMLQFGCQFICSTHTKFCSLVNNSILKGTLQMEIKMFSSCSIRKSAMLQFGCQFIRSTHTKFYSLLNELLLEEILQIEFKTFRHIPIRNSALFPFGSQFIHSIYTRFCSLANEQLLKGNITDGIQNIQLHSYQKKCLSI
ncbi:uncharacterized protein [Saccopteryx bilineata]|uniref:uncharacterized protein n=1 Tax=Saccopteryx bilineata TaxID=59482 RepID=UPI00338F643A